MVFNLFLFVRRNKRVIKLQRNKIFSTFLCSLWFGVLVGNKIGTDLFGAVPIYLIRCMCLLALYFSHYAQEVSTPNLSDVFI